MKIGNMIPTPYQNLQGPGMLQNSRPVRQESPVPAVKFSPSAKMQSMVSKASVAAQEARALTSPAMLKDIGQRCLSQGKQQVSAKAGQLSDWFRQSSLSKSLASSVSAQIGNLAEKPAGMSGIKQRNQTISGLSQERDQVIEELGFASKERTCFKQDLSDAQGQLHSLEHQKEKLEAKGYGANEPKMRNLVQEIERTKTKILNVEMNLKSTDQKLTQLNEQKTQLTFAMCRVDPAFASQQLVTQLTAQGGPNENFEERGERIADMHMARALIKDLGFNDFEIEAMHQNPDQLQQKLLAVLQPAPQA